MNSFQIILYLQADHGYGMEFLPITPNFCMYHAALGACKEYGMKEVLCTAWMDNGAETPVDALLPGVALFAHLGFS